MMNAGDLPWLAAILVVAALLTLLAFLVVRSLISNFHTIWTVSGLTVPILLIGLALGIETWNPDPHGWVLAFLLFNAALCLPVTLLVSAFLAKRYAKRDTPTG